VERRRAADLVADRVNQAIRERPRARSFKRWLPLLLSAAAGFLIAVGIFPALAQRSRTVDSVAED